MGFCRVIEAVKIINDDCAQVAKVRELDDIFQVRLIAGAQRKNLRRDSQIAEMLRDRRCLANSRRTFEDEAAAWSSDAYFDLIVPIRLDECVGGNTGEPEDLFKVRHRVLGSELIARYIGRCPNAINGVSI